MTMSSRPVQPACRLVALALGTILAMTVLATITMAMSASASAQIADNTGSAITPFPEKDIYRTYVLGDSMADGISTGLSDALRDEKSVELFKKTKSNSGFTRPDIQDWTAVIKETTAKERFHIVIVIMGAADRRPISVASEKRGFDKKGADKKAGEKLRPLLVGSDEWKQEYGRRVEEFLKTFRRSAAAVYWVGLPVMKAASASEDMQMINAIVREKVALHGGKFIDTWNGFTDINGQYSASGPDVTGKVKTLRDGDGVLFSKDGYRKLAHFVERELRRDLAIAKAERNVPLAGSEPEQRRVNPVKAAAARAALEPAATSGIGSAEAQAGRPGSLSIAATTRAGASAAVAGGASRSLQASAGEAGEPAAATEQKADPGRVSFAQGGEAGGRAETVVIDIVRPAIPAQVIAHVTRTANPNKAAPVGENIARALPDSGLGRGMLTMSSVTTMMEIAGAARRNMSATQTPHYKVLIKGEAMPAKAGRADDFRWPRDPALW